MVNAKGYQGSLRKNKTSSNKAQNKLSMPGLLSPAFLGESCCGSLSAQGGQRGKKKKGWQCGGVSTAFVIGKRVHVLVENAHIFCHDFGS